MRRCAGARGIRRDHWRLAAYGVVRVAAATHSPARPAGRGVQVVSRSAQVWRRATRGLRYGDRARGGVDLRPGARARDHTLSAHAVPAVSVNVVFDPALKASAGWGTRAVYPNEVVSIAAAKN